MYVIHVTAGFRVDKEDYQETRHPFKSERRRIARESKGEGFKFGETTPNLASNSELLVQTKLHRLFWNWIIGK